MTKKPDPTRQDLPEIVSATMSEALELSLRRREHLVLQSKRERDEDLAAWCRLLDLRDAKRAELEMPHTEATSYLSEHLPEALAPHRNYFNWSMDFESYLKSTTVRNGFIQQFGFAILDRRALRVLAGLGPLLEVGAGSGYWSYELRTAGADVVATDLAPNATNRYGFEKFWGEVEELDGVSAVAKYPGRTLLIVWPDYHLDWSYDALKAYTGKKVIYVGEAFPGCTGCEEFHRMLDDDFEEVLELRIPQFEYMRDAVWIYERRG